MKKKRKRIICRWWRPLNRLRSGIEMKQPAHVRYAGRHDLCDCGEKDGEYFLACSLIGK